MSKTIVVGVTGASGAVYARRLLAGLARAGADIHLVVSDLGRAVAQTELGDEGSLVAPVPAPGRLTSHRHDDLFDTLASGSTPTDGMVVCPCSCHTLGAIAAGLGDNLITRSAHVHLKERRDLVLCVREMPFTQIDLENMRRVGQAGAVVCAAAPAFYGQPETLEDLVDSVVGRLLDCLNIPNDMAARWRGPTDSASGDPNPDG